MHKIIFIIVLFISFSLFPQGSSEDIDQTELEFKVLFSGVNLKSLGDNHAVLNEVPSFLKDKLTDFNRAEDSLLYIPLGKRSTGGYSIELIDIVEGDDGSVKIYVSEILPDVNSMVTMAITYPGIVVYINRSIETFEVHWEK